MPTASVQLASTAGTNTTTAIATFETATTAESAISIKPQRALAAAMKQGDTPHKHRVQQAYLTCTKPPADSAVAGEEPQSAQHVRAVTLHRDNVFVVLQLERGQLACMGPAHRCKYQDKSTLVNEEQLQTMRQLTTAI
jgi:hypothetical protein